MMTSMAMTRLDSAQRNDPKRAWSVTLLFTAVIAAAYAFGVYLFPALLPDMRRSLGFDYADAGMIAALRQSSFLLTALASASMVARFGAGRVVFGSLCLCSVALCYVGACSAISTAAAGLIVLNGCAASAWIPMVSIVSQVVDIQHRGKAIGLIASGTNLGLCVNGLAVPPILAMFGWRVVWVASGGLTLLLCSLLDLRRQSWRLATRTPDLLVYGLAALGGLAGVPFANYYSAYLRDGLHLSADVSGAGWFSMGIAGAAGGVLFGAAGDRAGLRVALALTTTLFSIAAFIVSTTTTKLLLVLGAGCFGVSFFTIFGLLPAYVAKTTGPELAPTICGLVECSLGVGGAFGSFLGGLSPHMFGSFRPVFLMSGVLAAVMTGMVALLPHESRLLDSPVN
jgi:predicted MFS family arabinose efflux permease